MAEPVLPRTGAAGGTPHLYHFTVYALDQALGLEPGLTRGQLLRAMEGHVIGQGEIVPIYERF